MRPTEARLDAHVAGRSNNWITRSKSAEMKHAGADTEEHGVHGCPGFLDVADESLPVNEGKMETVTAPCSHCLKETHQNVLHSIEQEIDYGDPDAGVAEVYKFLQRAGCHTISMANYSYADWECYRTRYYPSPAKRKPPSWRSELPLGGGLFDEIYEAVGGGQYRLAVMRIRALLERVMISKINDHRTFEKNLNAFCEGGYISTVQRDAMNDILHVGHATMHRPFNPNEGDVSTALDITENILSAIYVHGEAAAEVAARIPPRPPRTKKR